MAWLTTWFAELRLRRAARKYGRRLGPYLSRAYGPGECYTAGQIKAAVAALTLPPHAIRMAYAAYMPEAQFVELGGSMREHDRLRSLVRRYTEAGYRPAFEPAAENGYARGGDVPGHF